MEGEIIMTIYDFTVKDIEGKEISLKDYSGKVLLIVNTATGCGFTPQYEGLQALYEKYKSRGFEILDFPCNQFLGQAPGTNDEIAAFCQLNYNTSFKTFAKIDVNGESAIPLYKYLKEEMPADIENNQTEGFLEKLKELGQDFPGNSIKWNFTKFLIDKEGNVVKRFSPTVSPKELEDEIEKLL